VTSSGATATVVYTDGACLGNPGPGGWAWAVPDGPFASGAEARSTNQRMEITAALEALRALPGRVHVMSDSTYVVNCWRDRWWEKWVERGWKNSRREPVANRDLWEPLVALFVERRGEVTFEWVKGHGDDRFNDLVDRLAVDAARTQQGRSGHGTPVDLGAPDAADEPAGREPRADRAGRAGGGGGPEAKLPDGRRLLVAGHRPPELGGYDDNPVADRVRGKLAEIISAKRELHPDLVVLTGLQLGAEQLGAEAAAAAGVPYVAVLAYPEQEAVWPRASQERFRRLLDGAAERIVLQRKRPESRQQAGAALARRDAWLARHSHEAVAVWDGEDPAVAKLTRSLEDHLGDDVWVLDPTGT
jgi:ribonuclease HI